MTEANVADTGPPISNNVRAELARARITHERMAAGLGISYAAFRRRLHGDVPWRINELDRIAHVLNVPLSRLTEGPGR